MKKLALILLLMFSGCTQVNKMQSAADLITGFCWKGIQQPGSLDAYLSTPARMCAGYLLCKQVGIYLDGGPSYCANVGMRGQ